MKVRIDAIDVYLDGGTNRIVLSDGLTYFVDNRIQSTTRGEVYASYPKKGKELTPVTDREKNILMECLEEYGKESGLYDVGETIYAISATMKESKPTGYTVVDVHTENVVVGYTVMADNGDEQYLTVDEFNTFKTNREKLA